MEGISSHPAASRRRLLSHLSHKAILMETSWVTCFCGKLKPKNFHWHAPAEVTRVNGCPFPPTTAQKSTSKHVPLDGICWTIRRGTMQGDRISPSLFCFMHVLPYPHRQSLQDATPTAGKFRDIFTKCTKGPWGRARGGRFTFSMEPAQSSQK